MSRTRSIYSLRSESLFEQPICLDGKVLGILEHKKRICGTLLVFLMGLIIGSQKL
jgi:hypothetical protein